MTPLRPGEQIHHVTPLARVRHVGGSTKEVRFVGIDRASNLVRVYWPMTGIVCFRRDGHPLSREVTQWTIEPAELARLEGDGAAAVH